MSIDKKDDISVFPGTSVVEPILFILIALLFMFFFIWVTGVVYN